MPLQTQSWRRIISPDQLTPAQRDQVSAAGKLYDGQDLPVEARVAAEEDGVAFYDLKHAEIHLDGAHAYDSWTYNVDSGTTFIANTTEVVGELVQCTFERRHTPAGARFAALRAESK